MRRKMFLVILLSGCALSGLHSQPPTASLTAAMTVTAAGFAELKDFKPGFNLFSSQQDIELGREGAAEVARQQPVVRNSEINNYLTNLVQRLARSPHAS